MKSIANIEYEAFRWEIVECADFSLRAAKRAARRMGEQSTNLKWEPDLANNRIVTKLRLVLKDDSGELILKFVLRAHFAILGTEEITETRSLMIMPKDAVYAIAHDVWDYAMDYLSKRDTPVSQISIPRPPDEGLISGVDFNISLN